MSDNVTPRTIKGQFTVIEQKRVMNDAMSKVLSAYCEAQQPLLIGLRMTIITGVFLPLAETVAVNWRLLSLEAD